MPHSRLKSPNESATQKAGPADSGDGPWFSLYCGVPFIITPQSVPVRPKASSTLSA